MIAPRHSLLMERGFTLVEIMVSLGIIAVLLILLSTGLMRVRHASEEAKCAMNLRALGMGILSYAGDNGGYLPPGSRAAMGGTLPRILADYTMPMKSANMAADIFYCPTNVRLGSPPQNGYPEGYKAYSGYPIGYLINASIFLITNSDPLNAGYTPDTEARVKLAAVNLPTRTVALGDIRTRALGASGPPTSGLAKASYFNPQNSSFSFGLVHAKKVNILFVDGHVGAFTGTAPLSAASLPQQEKPWYP